MQVFRHGVEEGEQVGVLLLDASHIKKVEQLLQQFVQGHQPQRFQAREEGFG